MFQDIEAVLLKLLDVSKDGRRVEGEESPAFYEEGIKNMFLFCLKIKAIPQPPEMIMSEANKAAEDFVDVSMEDSSIGNRLPYSSFFKRTLNQLEGYLLRQPNKKTLLFRIWKRTFSMKSRDIFWRSPWMRRYLKKYFTSTPSK